MTLYLCHSAFVRVATMVSAFATAFIVFATAHSRGLRQVTELGKPPHEPLPQRIRAGCDFNWKREHSRDNAFATAHSRGLRRICEFY